MQLSDLDGKNKEVQEKIETIESYFATNFKSQKFDGREGREVQHIKAYYQTCAIITSEGFHKSPEDMYVIPFFQSLDLIKERHKPKINGQPDKG